MKRRITIIGLLLVGASLGACYETSYDKVIASLDTGTPPPPPPPPPTGFGANFSEIQTNVFTPNCATSSCHAGASPSAGLNLDSTNSYAMLVGVASSQDAGTQRVNPMNPNMSYLITKLEGAGVSGVQMPPSGALAQSDIDTIRQWITAGAVDDRVPASTPIRVSSLSIMPGSTLMATPATITAGFDRAPDESTVNLNTFILEGSNNDGIFDDGDNVAVAALSVTVPGANTQSAVFNFGGASLADDTYRVRLLGSGASFIMDMDANALDGEYLGVFPSGNSTAGGDFAVQFTIAAPVVIGPTLDQIQAAVFTPTCATSTCHSNANQAAGLALGDADTSFAELVGEFSNQVGQDTVLLVAPMDPNASYLIRKLDGVNISGGRMPPGGALAQSDIDQIRQWIMDGAAR